MRQVGISGHLHAHAHEREFGAPSAEHETKTCMRPPQVTFWNVQQLMDVKRELQPALRRNRAKAATADAYGVLAAAAGQPAASARAAGCCLYLPISHSNSEGGAVLMPQGDEVVPLVYQEHGAIYRRHACVFCLIRTRWTRWWTCASTTCRTTCASRSTPASAAATGSPCAPRCRVPEGSRLAFRP